MELRVIKNRHRTPSVGDYVELEDDDSDGWAEHVEIEDWFRQEMLSGSQAHRSGGPKVFIIQGHEYFRPGSE